MVELPGAQWRRAVATIKKTLKALPICAAGMNPPGSVAVVFSRQPD